MFAEYIYDQKNFLVKVTHDLNLIPQVISKLDFLITMNGLQKWFPLAKVTVNVFSKLDF